MKTGIPRPVKPPLRVGLLVDSLQQPAWIHKVVADIQESEFAEVVAVVVNVQPQRNRGFSRRTIWNALHLLYLVYRKIDRSVGKANPDAFQLSSIAESASGGRTYTVNAKPSGRTSDVRDEDFEAVVKLDLDVALLFGSRTFWDWSLDIAKHGVWSYDRGTYGEAEDDESGFWRLAKTGTLSQSSLRLLADEPTRERAIYRSYASTPSNFATRNSNRDRWKAAEFVIRKLRDVYEDGSIEPVKSSKQAGPTEAGDHPNRAPGNLEMLALLGRVATRYVHDKILDLVYVDDWRLGYRFGDVPIQSGGWSPGFREISPPQDRFWADPFPVRSNGAYFVFVEEFLRKESKGHISVIELDGNGSTGPPIRVLEQDYHLSYPFVFEWKSERYMLPETRAKRTVELYRCVEFPYDWELATVLMNDVNAVDATLVQVAGLWWMFVNMAGTGASTQDELHLFHSLSPLGPWQPHRRNPVKSDIRSARPAGRIFTLDGYLCRPSQDSSIRYGYAISINRIDRIDIDEYNETELFKLPPNWTNGLLGAHTLNMCDGIAFTDGFGRRRRFF